MNSQDIKEYLNSVVPKVEYFYIQRVPYSIKGVPAYNIYFNTRIPGSKLSLTTIAAQEVFNTFLLVNGHIKKVDADHPILLEDFSRPIHPNSILNLIDLAGEHLAKEKNI